MQEEGSQHDASERAEDEGLPDAAAQRQQLALADHHNYAEQAGAIDPEYLGKALCPLEACSSSLGPAADA